MPSVTLHLVLADRVLERWLDAPQGAPFDSSNPTYVNAFYQGSIGPDFGYFPGGHKLLSELSHLVRSGDLTRALVRQARTPLERAFSWGWVTHVLADKAIHPLVGRAVGEFVYGDREIFADGTLHQPAHVQVETGLDAFYSRLFPALRHRKMVPVFNRDSISFIQEAYQGVYSLPLGLNVFLSSHLATVRMSMQGLATVGLLSTALLAKPVSASFSGARWALQGTLALLKMALRKDSLLKAFINPVPPAEWFVESVGEKVESFAEDFLRYYRTDLSGLENHNLDTGAVQKSPPTHPGTLRALQALIQAGGMLPPGYQDTPLSADPSRTASTAAQGAYD